jgi:hypothetical protein
VIVPALLTLAVSRIFTGDFDEGERCLQRAGKGPRRRRRTRHQAARAHCQRLAAGRWYLPTNLSRPQIAAELSVSVNTVSTHIRSIYAKLDARDRSAAVRRARELRLLSAAHASASTATCPVPG